jgi:hypothetical protein
MSRSRKVREISGSLALLALITNPEKNFRIIMKDGKIYKNTL